LKINKLEFVCEWKIDESEDYVICGPIFGDLLPFSFCRIKLEEVDDEKLFLDEVDFSVFPKKQDVKIISIDE
jgi:hypothetical protein